jgi:urea transporter
MLFGYGLSQVILQRSLACAIFFAAGLLACSPSMTLGALAGLVISTITGIMLEKQKGKVEDGLYG